MAADNMSKLINEFEKGISLDKCRECGCMIGALEEIRGNLSQCDEPDNRLKEKVNSWIEKTQNSVYT